jgi:hypothetical protein
MAVGLSADPNIFADAQSSIATDPNAPSSTSAWTDFVNAISYPFTSSVTANSYLVDATQGGDGSTVIPATVASVADSITSAPGTIAEAIQSAIPSTTSVYVWVGIIIVVLLLVAYISREVVG